MVTVLDGPYPAHYVTSEGEVLTPQRATATQAMLWRQAQPAATPCGIVTPPAPCRRLSLALCDQIDGVAKGLAGTPGRGFAPPPAASGT